MSFEVSSSSSSLIMKLISITFMSCSVILIPAESSPHLNQNIISCYKEAAAAAAVFEEEGSENSTTECLEASLCPSIRPQQVQSIKWNFLTNEGGLLPYAVLHALGKLIALSLCGFFLSLAGRFCTSSVLVKYLGSFPCTGMRFVGSNPHGCRYAAWISRLERFCCSTRSSCM